MDSKYFKIITVILFVLYNQTIHAQDSLSVRVNTGFAGYANPFDGCYFSFDVGIPIVKGIEIAPTFTFETDLDYNRIKYYNNNWQDEQYIINDTKNSGGNMTGLIELYLFIKPLVYFKSKKLTQTDFGIGTGYGLSFYTNYYYNYERDNRDFRGVIIQSGIGQSFSAKTYYNYHIKNYFVGVVFGVNSFYYNDPISTFGLQFGLEL